LCTMRLSAGRASAVTAVPQSGRPERDRMPGSMKLNRPMASARFAADMPRKRATIESSMRGGDSRTRKPSFPAPSLPMPWFTSFTAFADVVTSFAPRVEYVLGDATFRRLEIEEAAAIVVRKHRDHDRPGRL